MIVQTLTYNGVDLAPMCKKNSLQVTPERKNGRRWTDFNGNAHQTTIGWTYTVKVDLNPITYAQARTIDTLLKGGPQTLIFSYAGASAAISQTSIMATFAFTPTFSSKYIEGASIQFTEATL